jgi:hypothetical protein
MGCVIIYEGQYGSIQKYCRKLNEQPKPPGVKGYKLQNGVIKIVMRKKKGNKYL